SRMNWSRFTVAPTERASHKNVRGVKRRGIPQKEDPARGDERGLRATAEAATASSAAREEERPQTVESKYRPAHGTAQTLLRNVCHAFGANAAPAGEASGAKRKRPHPRMGPEDSGQNPKSKVVAN